MDTPSNRVAVVRTRGRPAKGDAPPAAYEAVEAVISASAVPAVVECRGCGRRIEPMISTRRPDGTACCVCGFCGARFDYRPPAMRWLDGKAIAP